MNAYEISNSDNAIADAWNEYNPEKVPDTKSGKYKNIFLTDDDRNTSMLENIYRNPKNNFQIQKWKYNVIITFYHEKYTKKLEDF